MTKREIPQTPVEADTARIYLHYIDVSNYQAAVMRRQGTGLVVEFEVDFESRGASQPRGRLLIGKGWLLSDHHEATVAEALGHYLNSLDGEAKRQPLAWHMARGIALNLASVAAAAIDQRKALDEREAGSRQ